MPSPLERLSLSRRSVLKGLAALSGGVFLGAASASAAPAASRPAAIAPARQSFRGQLIISPWHIGSGEPSELAQQALTEAYKKYQPDVELIWEIQVGGNYIEWLGTQLAAGDVRPDIVSGNYQSTYSRFVDFYKYQFVTNPYTGNTWDEDWDWGYFVGDNGAGQRFFIGTQAVHLMWFYNQDIFESAGAQTPTSWDEFADVCAKIKASGVTPLGLHQNNVLQWLGEIYFDQYHRDWANIVRAQPGDWNFVPGKDDQFQYDPTDVDIQKHYTYSTQRYWKGVKEGTLRYDTPAMTDLIRNFKKIFPQYATSDLWVAPNRYALFLQQQVAMMKDASWSLFSLPRDLQAMDDTRRAALNLEAPPSTFRWSTFENPPMTGPLIKAPVRAVESIAGEYLSVVDKTAEQTAMAVDFMMFWISQPGYQQWADAFAASGKWNPSGPIIIKGVTPAPEFDQALRRLTLLGNAESAPNGFMTTGGYGSAMQREVLETFRETLEDRIPAEEFGRRFQQLISTKYYDDLIKAAGLSPETVNNPQIKPAA